MYTTINTGMDDVIPFSLISNGITISKAALSVLKFDVV